MYSDIGKKIKGLAIACFIIEAIGAVIAGIVLLFEGYTSAVFYGLLSITFGPFVAWVSSWLLYGFGELIDKVCDIEVNNRFGKQKSGVQAKNELDRVKKLEKLRSEGLITEEDFQNAVAKE